METDTTLHMLEPVEAFRIPNADIHQLRELMTQILALQDEFTGEHFEIVRGLVREMDGILSPSSFPFLQQTKAKQIDTP